MTSSAPDAAKRRSWAPVALAAIAIVVYLPSLITGFTADDFFILARVKALDGLAQPFAYFQFGFFEYFRPVAFLSHALDWDLWGLNFVGFHVTNVALHAVNTVLVYFLARRLVSGSAPVAAAVLFALHPAGHEAVYWIAARFDLLATCGTLAALLWLSRDDPASRVAGLTAFAAALLSKESAVSLLLMAPAWDVLVARRSARDTARRLAPVVAVAVAYVALRSLAADLDVTGGDRRLPKLLALGAAMAGVLWIARANDRAGVSASAFDRSPRLWTLPAAAGAIGLILLAVPATFSWTAEKLGFAGHVLYFSLSPFVLPPPAAWRFQPTSWSGAWPLLAAAVAALALAVVAIRRDGPHGVAVRFTCVFLIAALLPVSSMTGGLRYLYLSSAGVAIAGGWLWQRLFPRRPQLLRWIAALLVSVCLTQLFRAERAWHQAGDLTRHAIETMAGPGGDCDGADILLLTAPVGIGGVYGNLYWEAFDLLAGCAPKSFLTLLRVLEQDARIEVLDVAPHVIELRIAGYQGNVAASEDLRNFGAPIARGGTTQLETAVGRLETFPDGDTQVFRVTLAEAARSARRFYYSEGRVRR